MDVLVVAAVEAEAAAIRPVLPPTARVIVAGVGPAASAASTAAELRDTDGLVVSAGIAGGFAPLRPGDVAVASTVVFADLGAETADGFAAASELGFGRDRYEVSPKLAVELADRTAGHLGTVLTVATVTGTAARAAALAERHPDVVAEAMEGAGVAAAARLRGVPFAELRAISNMVGPRDRGAWALDVAMRALRVALRDALD